MANISPLHVFAIFQAAPGKLEKLKEILYEPLKQMHEKEEYSLRCLVTEKLEADPPELWLFETYESQQMVEQKHMKTPYFAQMKARMENEQVLSKPPTIVRTTAVMGFDIDRKFIG